MSCCRDTRSLRALDELDLQEVIVRDGSSWYETCLQALHSSAYGRLMVRTRRGAGMADTKSPLRRRRALV